MNARVNNQSAIPLRALIVEDAEDDAGLLVRALEQGGYDVTHQRVESAVAMRAALESRAWDIILSDHNMPEFDALAALELRRACGLDIPFVIVSGVIGEEAAVEAMRAGASDYVMKGHLARLLPVVQRELKEAGVRAGHRQEVAERLAAERALRESEARFRSLIAFSVDWYWEQDEEYRFVGFRGDLGVKPDRRAPEFVGKRRWDNPDANLTTEQWAKHRAMLDARQPFHDLEYSRPGADGERHWVTVSGEPVFDDAGRFTRYRGVGKDITERKRNESLLALEHAVARHLAGARDMADGMTAVLQAVCETEGWDFGRYWGADNAGMELRAGPSWCVRSERIEEFAQATLLRTFASGVGMAGKVWQSGEAMWIADAMQDKRVEHLDIATRAGLHGIFLFPVFAGGATIGVLSFASSEVRQPGERLLAAARMIGSQVGQFLQRKRAEEAQRVIGEQLRRFRLAMDNSADMILLIDRGTMLYVDVNPAVSRLLGYSRDELLGMGPQDILPVSREDLEKSYAELIANPQAKGAMASYYICKDGSHLPFESTRHILRSGDRWIIAAISRDIRERIASEQTLRDSETRFRQTFELAASGMAHVGLDGRFLDVNRKLCEMFGYARAELVGRSVKELSHPEDRDLTDAGRAKVHSKETPSASFEKRYLRRDGSVIWVSLTVANAYDSAENPIHDIAVMEDITERRMQQDRIERLTRVHAVLSGINAAIVRIREREELFRETCRIAVSAGGFLVARVIEIDQDGTARIAATTEVDPAAFEQVVAEFNRDPEGASSLLAQALRSGVTMVSNDIAGDRRVHSRAVLTQKGTYALALLPLTVGKRTAGVITLRAREAGMFDAEEMKLLTDLAGDISFALDNIEKEKKLDYLALYDSLTGLANRTLFQERLSQSIHAVAQSGGKFAVVLTDIDRLTAINESLGRKAGDALLEQVAARIVRVAGRTEAARLSADQFVMVLPTVKGRSEAGRIVQAMTRGCFSAPFSVNGTELRISAKAGIALFPNDGVDAETLIHHAEAALRKGKATGEPFTFFTRDLASRAGATISLENKLRQAMDKEEFVLHYQPKVDAEDRRIVGVEALIRWQSPELGLVPPMQFIPLMEETGMILEVGAWALSRAAADHLRWIGMGLAAPRIAVNVSAIQLRKKDFLDTVRQAVTRGASPMGLDLEITESLVMEDIAGNILKLKEARELGASIAIDDFGTGYSSLAYLAKLPVQTLKIDRSFIITMLDDADTMALVQTIISLAHSLRLKVVAEGVGAEGQAKMLRLLRCDEMQGYLFSKPLPFDEMSALLAQDLKETPK